MTYELDQLAADIRAALAAEPGAAGREKVLGLVEKALRDDAFVAAHLPERAPGAAPREVLYRQPVHSYTRALMAAVPYPDLERKLDVQTLAAGDGISSANWPAPYTITPGCEMEFLTLGDEHHVLVQAGTTQEDLPL